MDMFERNIRESFRLVKNDLMNLQDKLTELSQTQERTMEFINKMEKKQPKVVKQTIVKKVTPKPSKKPKVKVITKTIAKKAKKVFVASKTGNKLHSKNCPFAKNIKPKSQVIYKTKARAFNQGLKPCECMKRV